MTISLLGLSLFTIRPLQGKPVTTTIMIQDQAMKNVKENATTESPFACNLAGLNSEQRKLYTALVKKLHSSMQEVRELADGYAFRFSPEATNIKELAEFITYERLCCPFFDFDLEVERESGPAWLRLRGREGVKEFIRSEFGVK